MTATFEQAFVDLAELVRDAWEPTGYRADWPNVAGFVPPTDEPWIRVTMRHGAGGQGSLANHAGKRRWNREGTLWIQLFTPIGIGLLEGYRQAKILTDALQGAATEHCVWTRNVRINEVGKSGAFEQLNILADFTYDEIQ
jgi:hypothetical protein